MRIKTMEKNISRKHKKVRQIGKRIDKSKNTKKMKKLRKNDDLKKCKIKSWKDIEIDR